MMVNLLMYHAGMCNLVVKNKATQIVSKYYIFIYNNKKKKKYLLTFLEDSSDA
jgi:hypothetical protein